MHLVDRDEAVEQEITRNSRVRMPGLNDVERNVVMDSESESVDGPVLLLDPRFISAPTGYYEQE